MGDVELVTADRVAQVLVAMSLASFLLFGWDKRCAVNGWWRVPELWLLVTSAAGGSIGAWLATRVFRHKTRKTGFRLKLVGATIVNAAWVGVAVAA